MAEEQVELRIYNTMTKEKEIFTTKEPGKVSMYVCGVTAYDYSHLGHARAAVSFDILYRYLKHLGYEVKYVRNFTDVDDKIIKRANETGEDPLALSNRFCDEYNVDMSDLLCERPSKEPRVSDHIGEIKDMITQIINNDYAYVVEGDVFFSVEKFPNYGMLSGQKLEHNRAGERVAVDSRKRHPADFALWKAAKPGEPSWDSPWGPGRPGWHIECSAMSSCYLSHKFDIHGGGIDLIFPHHENEIAQSWAADNESRISYWLHNGHVTNNNEKMSKSLGNFFTIRQITERYHPLALRHFLISAHYRSPLNYSIDQLETSSDAVYYIFQTLEDCREALSPLLQEDTEKKEKVPQLIDAAKECIKKLNVEFQTKMSDDLQTVVLTGALLEALKFVNNSLKMLKKKMQQRAQLQLVHSLLEVEKEVKKVLSVLGLLPSLSYAEVLQQLKDKALKRGDLTEDEVLRLIEERRQARINKDFAKSDDVRTGLTAKGIALMDVGNETVWRPCIPSEPVVAQAVLTGEKTPKVEEKLSTLAVGQKAEEKSADPKGNGPPASST
ncbi:cysteine--tRNA ligase 2, cytoplasmic-like isoform X2 [Vicia villosa]|nr:cysteine--tRNA ligase 2, cytoplasmic-like [Vicia villosa]XP_058765617.1 cysteine--tRNA ligase 2, cytoplasmic-like [Vicia villosa]XP_058765618.1 cysteine--tRNA ligase 2, cytoplasmic-like [Vicia villosa]XP_058768981.1 cysteine--tRNA ligase 2, cytoplasmic-like isoform X2 [Vicia villosa]XP_058768987.1 cysteine--tRNA ligase 2, cytoplasmic-like isoform X2 [Vicia villosa]XP_058768996.1 cysteine--tRNA ligase 2, cytoplasmic-like isoform X2 [Vicia villosa]